VVDYNGPEDTFGFAVKTDIYITFRSSGVQVD